MPFIARRVSRQLTAGQSTGTFQVTHPDITTPDCGLVFTSGAILADGTVHNHGVYGFGAFDASNNQAISNRWRIGSGTTNTKRNFNDARASALINPSGNSARGAFTVTGFIPGGVECTYQDPYVDDYFADFWFFEGVQNHDIRSNVQLNGGSANIGFKPDILFVFSTTEGGYGSNAKGTFGVAVRDPGDDSVVQWAGGWDNRHGVTAVSMPMGIADTYVALRHTGASDYSAKYAVASFDETGYTFASAAQSMDDAVIVAIQLPADQHALAGLRQTRSAIGTDTIPTPYPSGAPDTDAFLLLAQDITVLTTATGAVPDRDALCWSLANTGAPVDQAVMGAYDDSTNGTSQSVSLFDESAILHLENGATAQVYHHARLTDLDGGVDIETTATDGTAYWYGWLAIQSGDAGPPPGEDVDVDLPTARLGLAARAPGTEAKDPVETQLPAERLALRTLAVTTSIPSDVEIETLTANLEMTPREPDTRTTEHIAAYLPTAQLGLIPRSPGVVVEADVDASLPRGSLVLRAYAPSTNDGGGDQSFLPRLALDARASEPGVFVEFDVYTQLSAVRYRLGASAPGIYLAGDKISTPSTARLRAMAAGPRVTVGDPADMGPEDGGAIGPTVTDVVVPPTEQPAVP